MNFKDPISTFVYSLISLYHDIMWYIIIILSLVYRSLYKIVKEYSWNNFNKVEGFLLGMSNKKIIFQIQAYIFCILKFLTNIIEDLLISVMSLKWNNWVNNKNA